MGEETLVHRFRDFSHSRLFWVVYQLPFLVTNSNVVSVQQWIDYVHQELSSTEFEFFVTSCWSHWSHRNKIVHEMVGYDALESVNFIHYKAAQTAYSSPRPPEQQQAWSPSAAGIVKVNYDASDSVASFGIVARDVDGRILAWKRCSSRNVSSAEQLKRKPW